MVCYNYHMRLSPQESFDWLTKQIGAVTKSVTRVMGGLETVSKAVIALNGRATRLEKRLIRLEQKLEELST